MPQLPRCSNSTWWLSPRQTCTICSKLIEYCFDHDLSVSVMAYSKEGLEVPFVLPSSCRRQIAADSVYVKGSDFDNYVEALTSTSQKDTIFKAEYTIK